jgi:preprotein translocase subunit SecB
MADQQVFSIQRLYLKEASLEQPNSPGILLEQGQPKVEVSLDVDVEPTTQRPGIHEIIVHATVQAKIADKILFLVKCKQAGMFEIRNLTETQLTAILNVVCPQIIYPYLRSNVTDLIVRGGFMPVHLAEINFHALHEQRKAQGQGAKTITIGTTNNIINSN